jgi:hypothetical protein
MATRQSIARLSERIDRLAGPPRRVIVFGSDEADCRERLVEMRARGEVDDSSEIFSVYTGVPRHHRAGIVS